MYEIILASGSPRRREIMETMGISYKVVTAEVDEVTKEKEPSNIVQALSSLKTNEVSSLLTKTGDMRGVIIIGADTMVFYQDHALGKPKNEADAARMLELLSNDVHEVYTGVSILIYDNEGKKENISFSVCTKVYVQSLTIQQIMDYIATGEPMDKAGAYAIQGKFGIYIKEIRGDYYNVVGFPIAQIYQALLQKGIDMKKLN